MEHEEDNETSRNWCAWYHPQMIGKRTGRLGTKRTSRDHRGNNIIKIGQNSEKSSEDLRILGVTQTQETIIYRLCERLPKEYLDLVRESKKLWNMKVTIVPLVIGALGTITKGLLKGLEDLEVGGRVETIQMTALLRTTRIPRRVLDTWGDL